MWRLTEDCGVINRYGFNSEGMAEVSRRLEKVAEKDRPIGVNVGKNKLTPEDEAAEDYSKGIRKLGSKADYIVINVSSPNTPGLRNLQKKDLLQALLKKVVTVRNELGHRPPLLVKVAPDLDAQELKDVAEASLAAAVDGIIVSNTTIARPETLRSENKAMQGGLSGRPLRARATKAVHDMSLATDQKLPIVGVGGIANGQDAFDKIVVGASLVQLYSMMAFEGPSIGHRVNTELADLLRLHGFKSVKEAVGAAHRNPELMPSDLRGA
ncbi:Dihydroorotate dehydrogenase (quinone) [Diplonema papillatum]|nr:Dihydroorotate dehydrogenase (quinone) [Diplonema papillatum]